jgi:hypothetical protein
MKRKKDKFTPSTLEERHEFLRKVIRGVVEAHGSPCCCVLCEALIFDSMAQCGEINITTGERNIK